MLLIHQNNVSKNNSWTKKSYREKVSNKDHRYVSLFECEQESFVMLYGRKYTRHRLHAICIADDVNRSDVGNISEKFFDLITTQTDIVQWFESTCFWNVFKRWNEFNDLLWIFKRFEVFFCLCCTFKVTNKLCCFFFTTKFSSEESNRIWLEQENTNTV